MVEQARHPGPHPLHGHPKNPHAHDGTLYRQRHRIENAFARLKDWRRIATRYDRCPDIFMAAITLTVIVIFWIKE